MQCHFHFKILNFVNFFINMLFVIFLTYKKFTVKLCFCAEEFPNSASHDTLVPVALNGLENFWTRK